MHESRSSAKEEARRVREPSLPLPAYRVLHKLGLTNLSAKEFAAFETLYHDIKQGRVPARPSVLTESIVRVRHTLGVSGLSEQEFRAFIKNCQDEGLL